MQSTTIKSVRSTNARRGADVLLELLEAERVEYIFGNPGTTELPLMDALLNTPDISYVLGLQEASVVAMADGYAQASGKTGFLNLHTAGGLGHGMGNLLNASVSQTPLVVTAGQQDTRHIVTDPLLFGDLVQLATPAVKWAREVTSAAQLPVLIRRAFQDAAAAPAGAVFLSLPMDVMEEMSEVSTDGRSVVNHQCVAGGLEQLATELAKIRPGRLALVAGDEIRSCDAAEQAVETAELLGAHVYGSSWPSCIPFPTSHPLWKGNLPTLAARISDTLADYDAIFALGGKSLITILYSEASAIPQGVEVFQLSSDVRDLGRTYITRFSAVGHLKASLKAILPLLKAATGPKREAYDAVIREAALARESRRVEFTSHATVQFDEPQITPLVAAREAVRAIGPDIPIVDEAIATSRFIREFLNSDCARQYSFLRGGGLGWGMPAAVGFSLGLGRQPVVSLVGDGAALYSPQALWTAAHENLPVTFVVMNNREYNVLKNFMRSQEHYLSAKTGRFVAMDLSHPAIDYVSLAASFGIQARRVEQASDVGPAIQAGLTSGVPNLIDISVSC